MDSGFLTRVYRTSTLVWVFVLLWCIALRSVGGVAGVTIGFGISIGSLKVLEKFVSGILNRDISGKQKYTIVKLLVTAIIKYGVIGAILWLSLRLDWVSVPGLIVGIGLPQMVMFLKALGIVLSPETGQDRRV